MTLASAAFGFGQPLRPNLMFLVEVLALCRVLWWIRTLHIQIRRRRDHFLHVGFLSPPVSAQCPTELPGRALVHAKSAPLLFPHVPEWGGLGAALFFSPGSAL